MKIRQVDKENENKTNIKQIKRRNENKTNVEQIRNKPRKVTLFFYQFPYCT